VKVWEETPFGTAFNIPYTPAGEKEERLIECRNLLFKFPRVDNAEKAAQKRNPTARRSQMLSDPPLQANGQPHTGETWRALHPPAASRRTQKRGRGRGAGGGRAAGGRRSAGRAAQKAPKRKAQQKRASNTKRRHQTSRVDEEEEAPPQSSFEAAMDASDSEDEAPPARAVTRSSRARGRE
jgi:hypothetical protein